MSFCSHLIFLWLCTFFTVIFHVTLLAIPCRVCSHNLTCHTPTRIARSACRNIFTDPKTGYQKCEKNLENMQISAPIYFPSLEEVNGFSHDWDTEFYALKAGNNQFTMERAVSPSIAATISRFYGPTLELSCRSQCAEFDSRKSAGTDKGRCIGCRDGCEPSNAGVMFQKALAPHPQASHQPDAPRGHKAAAITGLCRRFPSL